MLLKVWTNIDWARADMRNARVNPWVLVAVLVLLMLSFEFFIKDASAVTDGAGKGLSTGAVMTTVSSLLSSVGMFIQTAMATANAKAMLLIPDGQSLLIAIAGMVLAWNAVLWILGGSLESILRSFITFVLMWGLAKYALDNYTSLTSTIGAGFDYIADKLGVDPYAFLSTLFKGAIAPMEAVNKLIESMSIREWANNFFSLIVISILAGIVSTAIFVVGAIVTAIIAVSQVLFAIAVVLGPILIPFMLLPPLSGLATGWLNYLIYTGFVKVVGVVMIVFMSGFTESLLKMTYTTEGSLNWSGYVGATVIVVLMAFLATMIMEIAAGIVGGSPLRGVLNAGANAAAGMGKKLMGANKR